MATIPEEREPSPPVAERVARAIVQPVRANRTGYLLAAAAAAGALAPIPFGPIAVALLVIVASDSARRR